MRYLTTPANPSQMPYPDNLFVPPGVSIVNNMMLSRLHRGPSALTYAWFYQQVRLHGPWDYKTRIGREYADFGNFNYGAVGTAAGIPEHVLLRAAGWAQSKSGNGEANNGHWYDSSPFGDDPNDQAWIKAGIEYAKTTGF